MTFWTSVLRFLSDAFPEGRNCDREGMLLEAITLPRELKVSMLSNLTGQAETSWREEIPQIVCLYNKFSKSLSGSQHVVLCGPLYYQSNSKGSQLFFCQIPVNQIHPYFLAFLHIPSRHPYCIFSFYLSKTQLNRYSP